VPFWVSPQSRSTIDVNAAVGMAPSFSTRVQTDRGGIMVERTMLWPGTTNGYPFAGHTSRGLPAASTTWYFADGDTRGVDTMLVLGNESDTLARVTLDFVRSDGAVQATYDIVPHSRLTLHTNRVPGLAQSAFWIRITSTVPITAERTIYIKRMFAWAGGDVTGGATAPSPTWFFGDVLTGFIFDTWLTLTNPQPFPANVQITWLRTGEPPVHETRTLEPGSRTSVLADSVPELASTSASVAIVADVPILAERAVGWPAFTGSLLENHTKIGASALGTRWLLAEGEIGGPQNLDCYVVIANPDSAPATVTLTLLRENRELLARTFLVPAMSRIMVRPVEIGLQSQERFGIQVDSDIPIAAERSMYWSAEGWYTRGGTNEVGYRVR
jgi:hypothetical protein